MRFFSSVLALMLVIAGASTARAATFVVDRTDDTQVSACSDAANDCTLRGAVAKAGAAAKANATAGAQDIRFDPKISGVITLQNGPIPVSGELNIQGTEGASLRVRRAAGGQVFQIAPNARVAVSQLRFAPSSAPATDLVETKGAPAQPQSEPAQAQLARARSARAVTRARVVRLQTDDLAQSDQVALPLFPGTTVQARQKRVEFRGARDFTWFGDLTAQTGGDAVISVQNGRVSANVEAPYGQSYQLRPLGEGLTVVQQMDQSLLPECGLNPGQEPVAVPHSPEVRGPNAWGNGPLKLGVPDGAQADGAQADSAQSIDVMVVYTAAAAASVSNINSEIQAGIDDTNQTFANSGITVRVRLVHAEQLSYTESGNINTDLSRLQNPGDGYMDEVHALRNTYKADLVSLWISNDASACGLGYLPATVSPTNDAQGFTAIVAPNCAVSNHSFAHELGHNMSAHHDRFVDSSDNQPFHHGYGYADPAHGFRTVMAYNNACSAQGVNCTRLAAWSNADRTYNSYPTGISDSQPAAADNRLTLNKAALAVANYRDASGVTPALIVTKLADTDDGACAYDDCSLREAIAASPTGGTITFADNLSGTIALANGQLQILRDLTIQGPTANRIAVSYSGASGSAVFYVGSATARISNLTIVGGASTYGIYSLGTMSLQNCTVRDGSYNLVCAGGTLSVSNSTLFGGQLGLYNDAQTSLANCTVSGSTQFGVYNASGTLSLSNTLVAGNANNTGGAFTSANSITLGTAADVGLDSAGLQFNGGPTPTIKLLAGSSAIDAGDPNFNGAGQFDQRGPGFARVSGARVDIGAYEVQSSAPTATVQLSSQTPKTNDVLTATVSASPGNAGDVLNYNYTWKVTHNGATSVVKTTTGSAQATDTLDLSVSGQGDKGDTITVSVEVKDQNGGTSGVQSASATVINSAPVIGGSAITTTLGRRVISRPSSVGDDDNDPLTFTASAPGSGTVSAISGPDGLFLYTPGAATGVVSFTISVSDGTASSVAAPQLINVVPAPSGTPLVYTAVGASDVQGVGASDYNASTGQSPANSYAPLLLGRENAMYGAGSFVLSRRAVNGFAAHDALRKVGGVSLLDLALADAPRALTVWYGPNDVVNFIRANPDPTSAQLQTFLTQFGSDYGSIIGALKSSGRAFAVANVPRIGESPIATSLGLSPAQKAALNSLCAQVSSIINQTAGAQNVPVVDLYNDTSGVPADISGDGFHPSDSGYAKLADKFFALLRPQLNRAPVAAAQTLSTTKNVSISGQLSATDADLDETAPPTFAKASDAAHGTVSVQSDGTFSYAPNPNSVGADSFSFTAHDGTATGAAATISINVQSGDTPSADDVAGQAYAGAAIGLVLSGSDPNGSALSYELTQAPAHGNALIEQGGDGITRLFYRSEPDFSGDDFALFVAVNAQGLRSIPARATITVLANGAPTANDVSGTTKAGQLLSLTLTGSDPENGPVTFKLVSQPANGSAAISQSQGVFQLFYRSNAGFQGNDEVQFVAVDDKGALSAPATARIAVAASAPPVADDVSGSVGSGQLLTLTLTGRDSQNRAVSFHKTGEPAHGQAVLSRGNDGITRLFYRSTPGYTGPDTVRFEAIDADGVHSMVATASITVTPSAPPTANDVSATIAAGQLSSLQLSGTDPNGGTLTFKIVSQPAHGTTAISSSSDGRTFLFYRSESGYQGRDTVKFVAINAGGAQSQPASATYDVTSNAAPTTNSVSGSVQSDKLLALPLSGTDSDGIIASYKITRQPLHGIAALSKGSDGVFVLFYRSNAGYTGPDSIGFVAVDNQGARSAEANAAITVTAPPQNDAGGGSGGGS